MWGAGGHCCTSVGVPLRGEKENIMRLKIFSAHSALYILLLTAAFAFAASCGRNAGAVAAGGDSTEVSFSHGADSVVWGYAGTESSDTLLDFIVPGSDPQFYDIRAARRSGGLVGDFLAGDRVAIVLAQDGKTLVRAIDVSSLTGKWMSVSDTDSLGRSLHGLQLGEDGSATEIASRPSHEPYRKWDLRDGRLVLGKAGLAGKDTLMRYDTLRIMSLSGDTLTLRPLGSGESEMMARQHDTKKESR